MKHVQFKLLSLCAASAILMAGCGGGGGGSNTAVVDNSTNPSSAIALNLNDTVTSAFVGTGFGQWTGDGGNDSGGIDAGGAAGDGEFVKVRLSFPAAGSGTLTWTILRSQYGKEGATGTLQIARETATDNGGYKVIGGRPQQSNIFVSKDGQISGTLPLPIGSAGAVRDVLFNGARFKDATSASLADIAGIYGAADISKTIAGPGIGQSGVGISLVKLNADGTGRICPDATVYSDACPNGWPITVAYDDPANKNLLRIRQGAGESKTLDMLAVVKSFAGGLSITGDFVSTYLGETSTGALYASRLSGSALDPLSTVGSWSIALTDVNQGGGNVSAKLAIADIGGTTKSAIQGASTCYISTLVPGPVNGSLQVNTQASGTDPASTGYAILLDTDSAVYVEPGNSLGIMRRFSMDPTSTGQCQPF
jgi:hypothetical protein